MIFELLMAINAFDNGGVIYIGVNTYEILSITNKMPTVFIDGFFIAILWSSWHGRMHSQKGN